MRFRPPCSVRALPSLSTYPSRVAAAAASQVKSDFKKPFVEWLKERPEIAKILDNVQYPEV
jgi:hypothetical protein